MHTKSNSRIHREIPRGQEQGFIVSDGTRATGPPLWERAGAEQASLDIAARKQPPSLPPPCLSEGKNTPLIHFPIVPFLHGMGVTSCRRVCIIQRNEESGEGSCDSGEIGAAPL